MLEEPEPPMRTVDEALSVARRATNRRTTHRLLGVAGVALGVAVAVAVVPGFHQGDARRPADPAADAAVDPAPAMVQAAQTVLPDPTAEQIQAHAREIIRILKAAVPAGFEAKEAYPESAGAPLWYVSDGTKPVDTATAQYAAIANVLILSDGRQGEISAVVMGDRKPAPTGDLCGAEVTARVDLPGTLLSCEVVTISGLPLRVTTYSDPERLTVINATWFVRNGYVTVSAAQGIPYYHPDANRPADAPASGGEVPANLPPLTSPVFTPQQVAAVAADPNLLP
jgi:hypothetical protein